jgi:vacuolar-type H+-ATPase subunit H
MSHDKARHPGPQEAIQRVQQAETEGRHIVQNAREQESAQILQQAEESAQKTRDEILAQAREQARQQRLSLIEKAEEEAAKIHAESEREAGALREAAESFFSEAVAKTADKIAALLRQR